MGSLAVHLGLFASSGIAVPKIDYTTILPELIVLGGMLLLLAASALVARPVPTEAYAVATAGIGLASLLASLTLWHDVQKGGAFLSVAKSVDVDGFACFALVLTSAIIIVAALL